MTSRENRQSSDQREETRKIQYTGGSSFIVSLPKRWIQELGLKQGDHVLISRQGNSFLQISPASRRSIKEQREATIEVLKENNPYYLARKLVSLYFLGYHMIHIFPKEINRLTSDQREVIKDLVRRLLMGTEIIADSASGMTLQVLINLLDLSVDAAFKRMILIAKSMHADVMLAMKENNMELAKEILKSDDEVDRFSFYIVRQLNIAIKNEYLLSEIGLQDSRSCLGYRLITKFAERIADHAVLIAKELIDSRQPINPNIVKRITAMSNFALGVLDEACLSMFKQDYNSADKAIEKAREIDYVEKSIMNDLSSLRNMNDIYRIKIITENLRRVAEYSSDIAEIVLNMTVQQTLKKGYTG